MYLVFQVMTSKEREIITDLTKCNFEQINEYFKKLSEERKNMSKEEKQVRTGREVLLDRQLKTVIICRKSKRRRTPFKKNTVWPLSMDTKRRSETFALNRRVCFVAVVPIRKWECSSDELCLKM